MGDECNIVSFARRDKRPRKRSKSTQLDRLEQVIEGNDRRLLEQAFLELRSSCVHIVLTTSALNELNAALDWGATEPHYHFEPPEPVLIRIAVSTVCQKVAKPELSLHINLMLARLANAKVLLRKFKARPEHIPTLRERDNLVDSWVSLSDAALLALDDFENLMSQVVAMSELAALHANSDDLRNGLMLARDGDTPWLVDRLPRRPQWAERRRCRRIPFNRDARLRYRGQTRTIRVRDVSEGGLGIEYCGELEPSEVVVVTLDNGRRFVGSVAWCHTDRAGILLATPLAPCDQILSGA